MGRPREPQPDDTEVAALPGPPWAQAAVLAVVYASIAKASLGLASIHASASPVWPPTGLAIAALLIAGTRLWPGILLGAFLANFATAGSAWTSLGIAAGNTMEALAAAWLARRFAGGARAFRAPRGVFAFAGLCGAAATTISPTVGVTSLALGGFAPWSAFGELWFTWWLGDCGGALLVTPLLVLWWAPSRPRWAFERLGEAVLLAGSAAVVCAAMFGGWAPAGGARPLAPSFLCVPLLAWAAFRFGPRETVTLAAALAGAAVWGTVRGNGPFVAGSPNDSLLNLQAFIAVHTVLASALAALNAERERAEGLLRHAHASLEERVAFRTAELARANEELERRRAELERSNADLAQFAFVASHDLQEPLRKISGFLDRLRELAGAGLAAEALFCLDRIGAGTERMTRLIDELLRLSRVTAQRDPLRPVDLSEVVGMALSDLEASIRASGATVVVGALPRAMGDSGQLRQLFVNLLSNALKFRREDKAPSIAVDGRERGGGFVEVVVTDDGIGFEDRDRELIFRPFRRLHPRSRYDGSGMGLSICARIAMRHGGEVTARGRPGRGAAFTVVLPASSGTTEGTWNHASTSSSSRTIQKTPS